MTTKVICIVAISVTVVAMMFLADKFLPRKDKKDTGEDGKS
jgi:hypothetical protein